MRLENIGRRLGYDRPSRLGGLQGTGNCRDPRHVKNGVHWEACPNHNRRQSTSADPLRSRSMNEYAGRYGGQRYGRGFPPTLYEDYSGEEELGGGIDGLNRLGLRGMEDERCMGMDRDGPNRGLRIDRSMGFDRDSDLDSRMRMRRGMSLDPEIGMDRSMGTDYSGFPNAFALQNARIGTPAMHSGRSMDIDGRSMSGMDANINLELDRRRMSMDSDRSIGFGNGIGLDRSMGLDRRMGLDSDIAFDPTNVMDRNRSIGFNQISGYQSPNASIHHSPLSHHYTPLNSPFIGEEYLQPDYPSGRIPPFHSPSSRLANGVPPPYMHSNPAIYHDHSGSPLSSRYGSIHTPEPSISSDFGLNLGIDPEMRMDPRNHSRAPAHNHSHVNLGRETLALSRATANAGASRSGNADYSNYRAPYVEDWMSSEDGGDDAMQRRGWTRQGSRRPSVIGSAGMGGFYEELDGIGRDGGSSSRRPGEFGRLG